MRWRDHVWILLILQTLVSVVPARGIALCAEASGEVHVELAHREIACPPHDHDELADRARAWSSAPGDVAPARCRDFRLGTGDPELNRGERVRYGVPTVALPILLPPRVLDAGRRLAGVQRLDPPPWRTALPGIVVLLV